MSETFKESFYVTLSLMLTMGMSMLFLTIEIHQHEHTSKTKIRNQRMLVHLDFYKTLEY